MKKHLLPLIFIFFSSYFNLTAQESQETSSDSTITQPNAGNLESQVQDLKQKIATLEGNNKKIEQYIDSVSSRKQDDLFRITTGASFDFIDQLSETDFYYDFNFIVPLIKSSGKFLKKHPGRKHILYLSGGIFQQKITVLEDSARPFGPFREFGPFLKSIINPDSLVVENKFSRQKTIRENQDIIKFRFSPSFPIRWRSTKSDNKSNDLQEEKTPTLFLALDAEIIFRDRNISTITETLGTVTDTLSREEYDNSGFRRSASGDFSVNEVDFYLGGSLLFTPATFKNIDFLFRTGAGISGRDISNPAPGIERRNWVIDADFRATEVKTGITIGGSVRFLKNWEQPIFNGPSEVSYITRVRGLVY